MRKISFFSLIVTVFLAVFVVTQVTTTQKSEAVSGSQFNAGRIIDNVIFYDSTSMNAPSIQSFLNSKVPACDTWHASGGGYSPPFTCLKDYSQNTPSKAADSYCLGNYAGGYYSSAQIIEKVANACGISPKVLIVLLQKEQSLITDTWPWPSQYEHATGYACPDTAACDPAYAGFFYQVYYAARQYQRYAKQSSLFNYTANQSNFILYNPNTSCGGSNVFIHNQATAGLYNYTPYQPNAAALNNLYGTGDGCSAYGNRNFWRLYNDWFGSTQSTLISTQGSGVYLVENGKKRPFPSEFIFYSYSYTYADVAILSPAALAVIPNGTPMKHFREGQLLSSDKNGVYLIENATKRAFPSALILLSHGYKWSDIKIVDSLELSNIPDGPLMAYERNGQLLSSDKNGVYLIENATKRAFPSALILLSHGYKWSDIKIASEAELSITPNGLPMLYNVHFRDGQLVAVDGSGVYLIENGVKRPFPNASVFLSYGYKWSDIITISSTELSLIPQSLPVAYNVHFRDGQLVTVDGSGVYLIENGVKRPFPNLETFISNSYSWPNVKKINAEEFNLIAYGLPMLYNVHFRDGRLVGTSSTGVFLVENGEKRPFPSASIFLSYGYKWSDIITISSTELSLIPYGTPMP